MHRQEIIDKRQEELQHHKEDIKMFKKKVASIIDKDSIEALYARSQLDRAAWHRKQCIQELTCLLYPCNLYTDPFFKKRPSNFGWTTPLSREFITRHSLRSFLDFGCATGEALRGALEAGVEEAHGFEFGYELAQKYIPEELQSYISYGDVTQPLPVEKFDVVWCLEVAEHIVPDLTKNFIRNLTKHASKFIVLTAHPEAAKGAKGHINLLHQSQWINMVERHKGWVYSKEETERTRDLWLSLGCLRYIRKNLMIFLHD